LPVADFYAVQDTLCITSNVFQFKNNSSVVDNSALTYSWTYSDGGADNVFEPTKTFATVGNFLAKMVVTSAYGCKDSTTRWVWVMPNGVPDFSWDSVCLNRPVLFKNLSNEKGSVQVNYNWAFNNGGPNSTVKNPPPVSFGTPGRTDIVLKLVTLGCEQDTQTITKPIYVNDPAAGVRYKTITVPFGSSHLIHIRDTIATNYLWRPQVQLENYDRPYNEFFATGNDVEYKIDMTDIHTCVTTDTILMQILKKPGYYLPTAFTPNGDGLNDVAKPYLIGMKGLKSFSVYNRWGNLIFYTEKYGEGWDGKFKGLNQQPGVYVWMLEFFDENNKKVTEKGVITIIR
jgi:gliding motility-associated-like protein